MKTHDSSVRRFAPTKLGLAVSAVLLGHALPSLANGLQPISGVGGTPTISQTEGVPIINIVKPNDTGLSHNQYLEYNVGENGLIINNSLTAGTSVGSLAVEANPQFIDNRSASTILNEVTGHNRSSILGRQEIFGDKADYVLSNPNGLWINEGWIDLKPGATATLLVGTPEIEAGLLTGLDSATAGRGRYADQQAKMVVSTKGMHVSGGALRLISPEVNSSGAISAAADLDILIGRHRVDAHSGAITRVDRQFAPVDARLMGAMRAHQIRIVTSQQGAGIRMPVTHVSARQGIDIESAGKLHIYARQDSPDRLERGLLSTEQGSVRLKSGQTMALQAVKVMGDDIDVVAGTDLVLSTLSAETQTTQTSAVDNPWYILPGGSTKTVISRTQEKVVGTHLAAQQAVQLYAGRNGSLTAATIDAGTDITLAARNNLVLDARIQTAREVVESEDRRPSPGTDGISRIEKLEREAIATDLNARDSVSASAAAITLKGAMVSAAQIALRADSGDLRVEGTQVTSELKNAQADRRLWVATKDLARDTTIKRYVGSHLWASQDIDLLANGKLLVQGSSIDSHPGRAQLKALQGIELLTGESSSQTVFTGKDWKLSWFAEETKKPGDGRPGSNQWVAGGGIQREKLIDTKTSTWAQGSQIKGGTVILDGGRSIRSKGALVDSLGDLTLNADTIELDASVDRQTFGNNITKDTVGMQWTGGLHRFGSSAFAEHAVVTDGNDQHIHTGTSLVAGKSLSIGAQTLKNVATQMVAGDTLSIKADTIINDVATDVVSTQVNHDKTKVSIGASVDYSDITSTIHKAVTGAEQSRFHQQNVDDNLVPWSVGFDLTADHQRRDTQALAHRAKVTQIIGGSVTLDVGDKIDDTGTQYSSHKGMTILKANEHSMKAAADTLTTSFNRLDIETLARFEAYTPVDFGAKFTASGYGNDRTDISSTAVLGRIHGRKGVQIQLGTNGLYEGTRFDSEGTGPLRAQGDITVRAGGNLTFSQANNSREFVDYTGQGKGSLKLAFGETTGIAMSASGNGRYSTSHGRDTHAQVGRFDTAGHVTVQAGGDLLMEGTHIGTAAHSVAGIDVSSGGILKVSAAQDTQREYGDVYAGGGNFKIGRDLGKHQTLEIGGSFLIGHTDVTEQRRTGAQWYTPMVAVLTSNSDHAHAIDLQGLQIDAGRIDLKAQAGGVRIAAAKSTLQRDNRTGGAGFGIGRVNAVKPGDDTASVHGRVVVKLDQLDSTTYANAALNGRSMDISTAADLKLQGATLTAGTLNGDIGGNLLVESLQDQVEGLKLDLDLRAEATHNPMSLLKGAKAIAGPFGKKTAETGPFSNTFSDKWSGMLKNWDDAVGVRVDLDYAQDPRSTVTQAAALTATDGWGLTVAGSTQLVGAAVSTPAHGAGLGASALTTRTLTGTDQHVGAAVHLATGKLDMVSQVYGALQKPQNLDSFANLGLIRLDRRNNEQTLVGEVQTHPL